MGPRCQTADIVDVPIRQLVGTAIDLNQVTAVRPIKLNQQRSGGGDVNLKKLSKTLSGNRTVVGGADGQGGLCRGVNAEGIGACARAIRSDFYCVDARSG